MIYVYTGKPGSGKTLDAMYDISRYIKRGQYVITNFNVQAGGYVKVIDTCDITPDLILDFFKGLRKDGQNESEFLLVLDEAQLIFNSRSWRENSVKGWITFFTQHRKYGIKIILITQQLDFLDKQIRGVIEYQVDHRRYSRFGVLGRFFGLVFGDFVALVSWVGGKGILYRYGFRYNSRYACMYNTNDILI